MPATRERTNPKIGNRARLRGRAGIDLDTLAAETATLFLREAKP